MNKKSQAPSIGPVFTIVIGILVLYFVYLLAIPSSEVSTYVGSGQGVFSPQSNQQGSLIQRPSYYDQLRMQRGVNLGSIHLFLGTQEISTLIAKELRVSSSWGQKFPQTRQFLLEDLQKASLTFDVIRKQGDANLILSLNKEEIFRGKRFPGSQVQIEIPSFQSNTLTISVQTPLLPFTQNSYDISELRVTGTRLSDNTKQIVQTSLDRPARGIIATASISRPDTLIITSENQTIFQRYLDSPQTIQAALPVDKQTTSPRVEFKILGSGDITLNDVTII